MHAPAVFGVFGVVPSPLAPLTFSHLPRDHCVAHLPTLSLHARPTSPNTVTAVYTVRATLQSLYMGSILMSRGDRFSWTGDAHPTQLTAMTVLGAYRFTFVNLDRTKGDCQGIATYCIYFVLSVADYWRETGNASAVAYFTPAVIGHLDAAAAIWDNPTGLAFVGWDDRLGSGFANHTTTETQHLFRLLCIRAWRAAASFFNETGNGAASSKYAQLATVSIAKMRTNVTGATPWWAALGLHAGGDAINAGFLTGAEAAGIAAGALSDVVKLPSQSNFNQCVRGGAGWSAKAGTVVHVVRVSLCGEQ